MTQRKPALAEICVTGARFQALLEQMVKWGMWFFWGSVGLAACGGKLVDGGARASAGAPSAGTANAGAPSAGAPNAGAPGAGASAGAAAGNGEAGEAGASTLRLGDGYIPCTDWCGRPAVDFTLGECVDGAWQCPAPLFDPNTCPSDACVLQRVTCCDHEFGKISWPACGADGKFGPCPTGFERNPEICVADSAHTTNCSSLIDASCTLEDAMCEAGGAHCRCQPGDGGLAWDCVFDLL